MSLDLTGIDVTGNTGTRALTSVLFASEMTTIIYDARWMLLLLIICVVGDFRYGWGESSKRYAAAQAADDKLCMAQYKWRTSRAVRRTVNKLIDYLIWVAIGMFAGMAILEPLGVNHMVGGVAATTIAVMCEAKSFFGHFFYLHGVVVEKKTLLGFFKAVCVAWTKRKSPELGEAIEEVINSKDKQI